MITILADENIAHLEDYFNHDNIRLIKLEGRDICQDTLDKYQPNALLIRSVTPINAKNMPNPKGIQFIGSATIGTDHVDDEFIYNHRIHFVNAKGSSKHSVAQYVITALLSKQPSLIHQKITLGIIGLGNIGQTLAKYAQNLCWDVLGHDPYLPPSKLNNSSFNELLTSSDVISIHTPLTKTGDHPTFELFDKPLLSKLRPQTFLVNTARGEIIRQQDLLYAIDDKHLQVILDVFPFEPTIDKSLLDKLSIATPHIAGYTLEGKLRGTDMIYQAFCEHFDLPITTQMQELLPPNHHSWQLLRDALLKGNHTLLHTYYNILKDDKSLRDACSDVVHGADFDRLRKEYHLKREWQYDEYA